MEHLFTMIADLRRAASDLRHAIARTDGDARAPLRDGLHRLDAEIWKMERAAADAYKALHERR